MSKIHENRNTDIMERDEFDLKEPEMYRVILHNDHYTTMEFVIEVLRVVFQKALPEATKIMMDVHQKGKGDVGVYSFDIARSKVARVASMAREESFPLKCTMENA